MNQKQRREREARRRAEARARASTKPSVLSSVLKAFLHQRMDAHEVTAGPAEKFTLGRVSVSSPSVALEFELGALSRGALWGLATTLGAGQLPSVDQLPAVLAVHPTCAKHAKAFCTHAAAASDALAPLLGTPAAVAWFLGLTQAYTRDAAAGDPQPQRRQLALARLKATDDLVSFPDRYRQLTEAMPPPPLLEEYYQEWNLL